MQIGICWQEAKLLIIMTERLKNNRDPGLTSQHYSQHARLPPQKPYSSLCQTPATTPKGCSPFICLCCTHCGGGGECPWCKGLTVLGKTRAFILMPEERGKMSFPSVPSMKVRAPLPTHTSSVSQDPLLVGLIGQA